MGSGGIAAVRSTEIRQAELLLALGRGATVEKKVGLADASRHRQGRAASPTISRRGNGRGIRDHELAVEHEELLEAGRSSRRDRRW